MKAVLFRAGSVPVHVRSKPVPGSTRPFLSRSDSLSGDRARNAISLNFEADRRRSVIRRVMSETEISGGIGFFPATIPEKSDGDRSRSALLNRAGTSFAASMPELGFSGGGFGNGRNIGGRGGGGEGDGDGDGGGFGKRSDLGEYYKRMLKTSPGDSLLLRNYGKYLQEVVGDLARAEEYYGRAILASHGGADGELLSLYGKVIWKIHRDWNRAKSYFDQAVSASPNDCTVLGSYAHFMWEAEEDEDEETNVSSAAGGSLLPAF